MRSAFLTLIGLGVLIWLAAPGTWAYTREECIGCHREGSEKSTLHIPIEGFRSSAHGSETECQDCHTGVLDDDHFDQKGSGKVDCSECHEQENRHGQKGEEGRRRPECYSCHTRHRMLAKDYPASSIHPRQLKQTCNPCHPEESGKTGFLSWLPSVRILSHKKGDFSKDYGEGNCTGCHQGLGAHGEEGPINEEGCQVCHMDDQGRSALYGYVHAKADIKKQPLTFISAMLYLALILFVLWMGFIACLVRAAGVRKEGRI